VAALTIQTRLPYYYLVSTFYFVSIQTSALCLLIDVVSATLPFYLLRRRIPAHDSRAPAGAVSNREILQNFDVFLRTTVLATASYAVIVYLSSATWLTVYMSTYFNDIGTFEKAHNTLLPAWIIGFIPMGWAARTFLFAPSTGAKPSLAGIRATAFNPETASLWQHVEHNLWGWGVGSKVFIKRTLVLSAMVGFSTWVRVSQTLEGSEFLGSAGFAAYWAFASLATGLLLRWTGNV